MSFFSSKWPPAFSTRHAGFFCLPTPSPFPFPQKMTSHETDMSVFSPNEYGMDHAPDTSPTHSGQVRNGSMHRSSASLHPLSAGTPGASVWPSPRQMPGPSKAPRDANQPATTTRHVVSPLASSTHEAHSLRESGEQDQHEENEPHVHTAAVDAHGYAGKKSHLSLSATACWT